MAPPSISVAQLWQLISFNLFEGGLTSIVRTRLSIDGEESYQSTEDLVANNVRNLLARSLGVKID